MSTAVPNRPQLVPTETHVERQLISSGARFVRYAYRLVWEGTVIASTEVVADTRATSEEIDTQGISWLLRAASTH